MKESLSMSHLSDGGERTSGQKQSTHSNDDLPNLSSEKIQSAERSTIDKTSVGKYYMKVEQQIKHYSSKILTLWKRREEWRLHLNPNQLIPRLVKYVPALFVGSTTLVNGTIHPYYPKIAILVNTILGCAGIMTVSYLVENWENRESEISDKLLMLTCASTLSISLSTLFGELVAGLGCLLGYGNFNNSSTLCSTIVHMGLNLFMLTWDEARIESKPVIPKQEMVIIPSPLDFSNKKGVFWRFKRMERKRRRIAREEDKKRQRKSWNKYLSDIDSIAVKPFTATQWFYW